MILHILDAEVRRFRAAVIVLHHCQEETRRRELLAVRSVIENVTQDPREFCLGLIWDLPTLIDGAFEQSQI